MILKKKYFLSTYGVDYMAILTMASIKIISKVCSELSRGLTYSRNVKV